MEMEAIRVAEETVVTAAVAEETVVTAAVARETVETEETEETEEKGEAEVTTEDSARHNRWDN
jgi:hypothetical protein